MIQLVIVTSEKEPRGVWAEDEREREITSHVYLKVQVKNKSCRIIYFIFFFGKKEERPPSLRAPLLSLKK